MVAHVYNGILFSSEKMKDIATHKHMDGYHNTMMNERSKSQ